MKKIINTPNAPAAIGPYSQAVEANDTLYISGQLPINPLVGKIDSLNVSVAASVIMFEAVRQRGLVK